VTLRFPLLAGSRQVFDNPFTGERAVILGDPFTPPDRAMAGDSPPARHPVPHEPWLPRRW
jgi:hypothetical protein